MNYEVVLANGTILNVNRQKHSDLLKALRGGSNNFGIVTQFDLITFPQGKFWGGDIFYEYSVAPQLVSAFVTFGAQKNYDKYGVLVAGVSYQGGTGQFAAIADLYYTKLVINPPVLAPLTKLQPQIFNTLRVDTLGSHTNTSYAAAQTGHR